MLNFGDATAQVTLEPPKYAAYYDPARSPGDPDIFGVFKETVDFLKTTNCLYLINPGFIMEYALLKTHPTMTAAGKKCVRCICRSILSVPIAKPPVG